MISLFVSFKDCPIVKSKISQYVFLFSTQLANHHHQMSLGIGRLFRRPYALVRYQQPLHEQGQNQQTSF